MNKKRPKIDLGFYEGDLVIHAANNWATSYFEIC